VTRVPLDAGSSLDDIRIATASWATTHIPQSWREAAARGGRAAIRAVRSYRDYEAWYPVFASSGLCSCDVASRIWRARLFG
jgi:hypothetical protein